MKAQIYIFKKHTHCIAKQNPKCSTVRPIAVKLWGLQNNKKKFLDIHIKDQVLLRERKSDWTHNSLKEHFIPKQIAGPFLGYLVFLSSNNVFQE